LRRPELSGCQPLSLGFRLLRCLWEWCLFKLLWSLYRLLCS